MPVRRFSYEFFRSVPVNAHGRTVASRKRSFAWEVDGCARPYGTQLKPCRRFGIHKEMPARRFHDFGDLGVGALRKQSRAECQCRNLKPRRDCRAFHHRASGKAKQQLWNKYRVYSFRHCRKAVNVTSVLGAPAERSTLGEIAWRVASLAKPCWQEVGSVRAALDTTRLGSRAKA